MVCHRDPVLIRRVRYGLYRELKSQFEHHSKNTNHISMKQMMRMLTSGERRRTHSGGSEIRKVSLWNWKASGLNESVSHSHLHFKVSGDPKESRKCEFMVGQILLSSGCPAA